MKTLNTKEVISIHDQLTEMFAPTDDPISPPGIKSIHLLESAINRQNAGFEGQFKYDDDHSNAATLMYGLCMNHCFHNGNKRTAFVAGIIHLDRNKRLLVDVRENDFFELMVHLASHSLLHLKDEIARDIIQRNFKGKRILTSDEEVDFLGIWLKKVTKLAQKKPRELRLGDLISSLKFHGCDVYEKDSNTVIEKNFKRRLVCFLNLPEKKSYEIRSTNPRWKVSPKIVDDLREHLELDQRHGFDDDIFFEYKSEVDAVLNEYRKLLGRLAKT